MTSSTIESLVSSAMFYSFCVTAESVKNLSKRLDKAATLGAYFDTLNDIDLNLAARFFANKLYPPKEKRTSGVGGSALIAAVALSTQTDADEVRRRVVETGDIGDAAYAILELTPTHDDPSGISLSDMETLCVQLADLSGPKRKVEALLSIFLPLNALELKYAVKLLVNDLRIGLQEGAVEDAVARWAGVPVGDIQWANMLVGDVGEAAVLARHGQLASAKMTLFHPIKFMLATPAADLADVARQMPAEFIVEDKFDGIRAQAHIQRVADHDDHVHGVVFEERRIALFSRTMDEITASFPDLVRPLSALIPSDAPTGEGLILDGEILPVDGELILAFQELQQRLGRKTPTAEMIAQVPVAFVAYDCLYAGATVLITQPFHERAAALDALIAPPSGFRRALSKWYTDVAPLDDEFIAARKRGNEGLMVKDPASIYKPGRRGREWLKIKRALATLDVVVTAVEVGSGRRSNMLSDYTFAVRASETDPTLLNIGKAYSGLTDAELVEQSAWFRSHTLQEFGHGKVRLVEPAVVIEVTFDHVQPSARHKSGFALRFPRIVRLRPDKPVSEIDTLQTVNELAILSASKNERTSVS